MRAGRWQPSEWVSWRRAAVATPRSGAVSRFRRTLVDIAAAPDLIKVPPELPQRFERSQTASTVPSPWWAGRPLDLTRLLEPR